LKINYKNVWQILSAVYQKLTLKYKLLIIFDERLVIFIQN